MGAKSKIEWTDATWNPVRGCSAVSPGCKNCFAARDAARFAGADDKQGTRGPFHGFVRISSSQPQWTGKVELMEHKLGEPLAWRKPQKIFVNSMSDLFHQALPDEAIDQIFAVMALCPRHSFQVLTKRPRRMMEYLADPETSERVDAFAWEMIEERVDPLNRRSDDIRATARSLQDGPLPNVWLGVSVEDQEMADERIPLLLQTPAAIHFVSYGPALGPVDFSRTPNDEFAHGFINPLRGFQSGDDGTRRRLDWIVAEGESGPGARPAHPQWFRDVRDQCVEAGVSFFFKQWGEWTPGENVDRRFGTVETAKWFDGRWRFSSENLARTDGHRDDQPDLYRVGKRAAGAFLDGREWREFPEVA